jgi:alpha-glucosidase (family GH31 glycosyl hydrolase)
MNEATGFCSGECYGGQPNLPTSGNPNYHEESDSEVKTILRRFLDAVNPYIDESNWYWSWADQSQNNTYNLPFIPGHWYGGNLDNMTLSLNATHPSINETEYNLHNLYGLMMAKRTYEFLTNSTVYNNSDRRPFILSRSTFASAG